MAARNGNDGIKNLTINITDRCNGQCYYCNIGKSYRSELTLEQLQSMCNNTAFSKVKVVSITGGEPFLHPDILNIVKLIIASFNLEKIFLNTNGSICYEKIKRVLDIIPESLKCYISISYEGGKNENLKIRGNDYSDNIRNIARKCLEYPNVVTSLSMTLCKYNSSFNSLRGLHDFANECHSEYSFRFADISDLYYHNSTFENNISNQSKIEIIHFIKKYCLDNPFLVKLMIFLDTGKVLYNGKRQDCVGGSCFAFIHSDGKVYSCIYGTKCIGTVERIIDNTKPMMCLNSCCTDCVVWPMIEYYGN